MILLTGAIAFHLAELYSIRCRFIELFKALEVIICVDVINDLGDKNYELGSTVTMIYCLCRGGLTAVTMIVKIV